MKVSNNYVLYVNNMLGVAYYGTRIFGNRISSATFGNVFDCDFAQLKSNIRILTKKGFSVYPRKY